MTIHKKKLFLNSYPHHASEEDDAIASFLKNSSSRLLGVSNSIMMITLQLFHYLFTCLSPASDYKHLGIKRKDTQKLFVE